jgi:hypothetical protein
MGVTGFFHTGVTVRDMDVSLGFYRDGPSGSASRS